MTNPIVIRFPPHVRLVEPKVETPPSDADWERKWKEGVAKRVLVKKLIRPSMFHRKQHGPVL